MKLMAWRVDSSYWIAELSDIAELAGDPGDARDGWLAV